MSSTSGPAGQRRSVTAVHDTGTGGVAKNLPPAQEKATKSLPATQSGELRLVVPNTGAASGQKGSLYLGRDVPLKVSVQDDKRVFDDPTFWLSGLAIVVSVASVVLNMWLASRAEAKARRQSIDDEFWLRNVLYPLSIQPALEFYSRISTQLPLDRYSPGATAQAVAAFKLDFDAGHSAVMAKITSLQVLSLSLLHSVQQELEAIEELVIDYCFANRSGFEPAASGTNDLRGPLGNQIVGHMTAVLQTIKALQVEIK